MSPAEMIPAWNPDVRIVEPNRAGGVIVDAILRYRAQAAPREEGLHCSTIVDDIIATLTPKKKRAFAEKTSLAYQEIGNVIEDVVGLALAQRFGWIKPSPKRYQGIWCSPDGWSAATRTIDEVKVTWASMYEFADSPKCHGYLLRALFYAHVWQAARIRLHVLFLNGDWRPPVPEPRTFIVRWKNGVLEQNARMILTHAKDRGWWLS